jgi:hypothetical protein
VRLPRLALALPTAALLLLAGCGGGASSGTAAPGTTTSAAGAASSAPAGAAAGAAAGTGSASSGASTSGYAAGRGTWGHMAGCPSVGRALPPGAVSRPTVDVDGDGRPDTAFIADSPDSSGGVAFGIRTASGGVFSATIRSASPVARSVLVADVTGHGEVIALASDNRQVQLWAVSACQLVPEQNAQGQQYAFDLGFTGYGTGVGCVDANGDGTTDLVGLKFVAEPQGAGTIQRTIVVLKGPQARNGATDSVPVTRASLADEAQAVTCGDLTMQKNGVTSGP